MQELSRCGEGFLDDAMKIIFAFPDVARA
ncbi:MULTISPECIES: hypothetical protein [Rhizobium]